METIVLMIIVVVSFLGAVALANSFNNDTESELRDEEKTPCTLEDYSYNLHLKK